MIWQNENMKAVAAYVRDSTGCQDLEHQVPAQAVSEGPSGRTSKSLRVAYEKDGSKVLALLDVIVVGTLIRY